MGIGLQTGLTNLELLASQARAYELVGKTLIVSIDKVEDLLTIDNTKFTIAIVSDISRGGTFIYDATKVANSDNGTNFNGWIRQDENNVDISWFGNTIDDDTLVWIDTLCSITKKTLLITQNIEVTKDIELNSAVLFNKDGILTNISNSTITFNNIVNSVSPPSVLGIGNVIFSMNEVKTVNLYLVAGV